jgi:hypothetical protein
MGREEVMGLSVVEVGTKAAQARGGGGGGGGGRGGEEVGQGGVGQGGPKDRLAKALMPPRG